MAKHHQQQQQLPRPTAPQTPMQQPLTPKVEAEIRVWLAVGTVEGKHACALLKTQGTRVLESLLLEARNGPTPSRDASTAEDTWEEASYPVLYHGETPTIAKAAMLDEGRALALHKAPNGKTAAVEVEVEGNRLLCGEGNFRVIFLGGRTEAWHELQAHAAHSLLANWQAERRRARRNA